MNDEPNADSNLDSDAQMTVLYEESFLQHFVKMTEDFYSLRFSEMFPVQAFRQALESCTHRNEAGQLIISYSILIAAMRKVFDLYVGTALAQLASENKIECAYDADVNDFVFWTKPDTSDANQTNDPDYM